MEESLGAVQDLAGIRIGTQKLVDQAVANTDSAPPNRLLLDDSKVGIQVGELRQAIIE
jgi:hypothetical protein